MVAQFHNDLNPQYHDDLNPQYHDDLNPQYHDDPKYKTILYRFKHQIYDLIDKHKSLKSKLNQNRDV